MRERVQEMNDIASVLDDVILKSEHLVQRDREREANQKRALRKSLSFDPFRPHEMTAESGFYNPYRQLGDGSYAPHRAAYWMEQAPGSMPDSEFGINTSKVWADEGGHAREVRADGYRSVEAFYRQAGVMKAVLNVEIDQITKGMDPRKPKRKLLPHEHVQMIKHHLKKRKGKDKQDKEKALDAKVKQHISSALADHFETHQIKNRVHSTMQKRLSTMGPQSKAILHQTASGMGRPPTSEESAWGGTSKPKSR